MAIPGPLPSSDRDIDALVLVPSRYDACATRVSPERNPAVGTDSWKEPSAARDRLPDLSVPGILHPADCTSDLEEFPRGRMSLPARTTEE
jgi:hypothetical protein